MPKAKHTKNRKVQRPRREKRSPFTCNQTNVCVLANRTKKLEEILLLEEGKKKHDKNRGKVNDLKIRIPDTESVSKFRKKLEAKKYKT